MCEVCEIPDNQTREIVKTLMAIHSLLQMIPSPEFIPSVELCIALQAFGKKLFEERSNVDKAKYAHIDVEKELEKTLITLRTLPSLTIDNTDMGNISGVIH